MDHSAWVKKSDEMSDKANASRLRILGAAAKLFREKGYASVNLRDIATSAGMKAGSLYYHFNSKDAIVSEILDAGIYAVHDEVKTAVERLAPDASAEELIHTGILTHLRSLFTHSDYTSANVRIYNQVPSPIRKANLKARRQYESLWDTILERASAQGTLRRDVDLKDFRLLLVSSLNATLEWHNPKRGSLDDLANSYANIMLKGLLTCGKNS